MSGMIPMPTMFLKGRRIPRFSRRHGASASWVGVGRRAVASEGPFLVSTKPVAYSGVADLVRSEEAWRALVACACHGIDVQ